MLAKIADFKGINDLSPKRPCGFLLRLHLSKEWGSDQTNQEQQATDDIEENRIPHHGNDNTGTAVDNQDGAVKRVKNRLKSMRVTNNCQQSLFSTN